MAAITATTGPDCLSIAVIEAIADATDADPIEMRPPLYTVVDLDALESVLASNANARITFEYDGQTVAAHGDGTVVVDEREYDPAGEVVR